MAITLAADATRRLQDSIQREVAEHLAQDVGVLEAAMQGKGDRR
jgi:hypothetical protein